MNVRRFASACFVSLSVTSSLLLARGSVSSTVVKLLSKRRWIPAVMRLAGSKLESEGPSSEVGFPTADLGFSSIQGTLFGFYGI